MPILARIGCLRFNAGRSKPVPAQFFAVPSYGAARYRWMKATAMAPSPAAEATPLDRAVPHVAGRNEPGTLVSRKKGGRSSGQTAGGRPSICRSGPVTRYPPLSRIIGVVLAHSVLGAPPMQMKTRRAGTGVCT